jgi:putative Ca2+/H+ antiporter (TMEM165/GDT1 family)
MDLGIAAAVFPIIFIGELPDKTMFASLVLATRGRPRAVWLGAAGAFLIHVVIATTIGVGLFALLPQRAVDGIVAALFLGGAAYAFVESNRDETGLIDHEVATHRRVVTTAFVVIFLAEWGDLTQILTANLAAHYHSPLSVGVGAVLALWCVAGLAVASGQSLLRVLSITVIRRVTGVVLLALAGYATWAAISG